MKYPSVGPIKTLHEEVVRTSGGSFGLRDEGRLDSAVKSLLFKESGFFIKIGRNLSVSQLSGI